jgi:hypothetical protein
MKKILNFALLLCGFAGATLSVPAQTAVPPPSPAYQPYSDQQLDQLLGPIALYPDPLLALILPASTLPTEIVLADRYVAGGGDPDQIEQQPWDASVQGLAHYPTVLKWLDDNLTWTTEVGNAFLNQQTDVMASIQRLRASAQNLGNLQSTPQQQVSDDGGDIEIVPVDPDEIYVPDYQPDQVFYQSGGPFITFGIGFAIGGWLNCDFDWYHRDLIVWGRDHPRPANWWRESRDQRAIVLASHTTVWRPVNHPGVGSASRGDRGWINNPAIRRPTPVAVHEVRVNDVRPVSQLNHIVGPAIHDVGQVSQLNHIAGPAIHDVGQSSPAPAPEEHFETSRPATSGAFVGIQSSEDTRTFSDRGQQSMETTTRSEPVSHSEPVSRPAPSSGGGGGGGHSSGGSGQQKR